MNTPTTEEQQQKQFLLGMLLSMFCWGLSWASGKVLSTYGAITSVAMFRLLITFVSLFLILIFIKEKIKINRSGWLSLFAAAVLMTVYNYLFFKGLFNGRPGAGGVLVTTLNPIISYGIMLLFALRKPSRKEAIGLAIGIVAGIVLLKAWDNWLSILSSGNLYFVLASLTWAILSLFTAKSSKYGSPVSFSLWMYGLCSVLMFSFTTMESNVALYQAGDTIFWFNMFFSAVITTSFATTFYFVATSRIGASKASSFIFLVPVSAALGSWVFLKEQPQWHTIVGGVLGIAAVYMLNKKESTETIKNALQK